MAAYTIVPGLFGELVNQGAKAVTKDKKVRKVAATLPWLGAAAGFAYGWGQCLASYSEVRNTAAKDYKGASDDIGYRSRV